jgi:hypothetical protein
MSMKAIAREVGASLSSVSRWVRDVELTEEQQATLQVQAFNGHVKGRAVNSAMRRRARVLAQDEGRQLAERREALHVAGCMLYWAEGAKERNVVGLSNSDADVVRFFLSFLRACFDVPDERVAIRCNLFADHLVRQREVEDFWLGYLGLPSTSLRKSIVNVYSKYSQRKRKNMLPYRTCKLTVCSTQILQSIYGSIQEYGGFERPEWLG